MEQDALAFIHTLEKLYLEQRDMEQLLPYMSQRTSWIGTGRNEICKNFQEAAQALMAERAECQSGFTVTDSWYESELLSSEVCVIYGEFWAEAKDSSLGMAELHQRISVVCTKTAEGMKLVHLHMSRPDEEQGAEFYVKQQTRAERGLLQLQYEQTIKKLHDRSQEMELLTANVPGGVHQCQNDEDLTIVNMSSGFLGIFGYSKEEIAALFQNRYLLMIDPQDRATFLEETKAQLSQGDSIELEYRVRCKNGALIWVMDRGRLVTGEDGTQSLFCITLDITDQKEEQERLRLMLERHKLIMDQTTDIIFEWDIGSDTVDFSSNWEKKFGYPPISEHVSTAIPLSGQIHPDDSSAFTKLLSDMTAGVPYSESEFRIRSVTYEYVWCRVRATAQFGQDHCPIKAVGVIIDIDNEKNRSRVLMEAAQRDALTKLNNKIATKTKIEHILSRQDNGNLHALLIIDVDNFKTINDRFGHQCGDAVLSNMAQALKKLFRATDVIGRIGGDEFLVFMSNLNDSDLVIKKAKAIVDIFREMPIEITADLSCSVGVALYPKDAVDYAGLSRCADSALYQVKNSGKVNFAFYQRAMRESVPEAITRTVINEGLGDTNSLNGELVQYAFGLLYSALDIQFAIHQILETVGRAYDVSRVYVFETSEDGLSCSNTYEWCNDGITPELENLQNLNFKTDLDGFFDLYDENGVFYCQDIGTLKSNLKWVLESQGIAAVLQCFIQDDGSFKGYVGFDECKKNRYWTKEQIHTLTLIANVLSTFLTKAQLKKQLASLRGEK